MKELREEQLPSLGQWFPGSTDPDLISGLPVSAPSDSWIRCISDPERGFPAVNFEVAWITPGVLHIVAVSGYSLATEVDGVDEREIVRHERLPLDTIQRLTMILTSNNAIAELVTGESREDLPGALLMPHID